MSNPRSLPVFVTLLVVASALFGLVPMAEGTNDARLDGALSAASSTHADPGFGTGPVDASHPAAGMVPVDRITNAVRDATESIGPHVVLIAGTTVRGRSVLDNETRREVYEAVTASPGIHLAALAESAGVSWSTARYHGRVLADESLVTAAKIRGKRRLYPAETADPRLAAALNEDATMAVLAALEQLEPIDVSSLAEAADIAPSTATYHLQRLAADDLIERERDGRTVVAHLTPSVRDVLTEIDDATGE